MQTAVLTVYDTTAVDYTHTERAGEKHYRVQRLLNTALPSSHFEKWNNTQIAYYSSISAFVLHPRIAEAANYSGRLFPMSAYVNCSQLSQLWKVPSFFEVSRLKLKSLGDLWARSNENPGGLSGFTPYTSWASKNAEGSQR